MATSKTLAPTNVTISIPAMTDAPNASVLSNCIDKEADAINALNSQFESNQPYTPDITSASTGFAVANKIFVYARTGKILLINGRFEITNVGSDTSKDFVISLPSGMECYDRVGACGFMAFNRNVANAEKLSLRQGVNQFYSQVGAGGSGALGMVSTGYIMINAVLMLK